MVMVQEGGQQTGAKGDTTLADLRKSVTAISEELATIVERRSRALREGTEAGAAELRKTIRRQPVLAIGVAAAAGALLALALVPRSGSRAPRSRWEGWMSHLPNMPQVSRSDLYEMAENIQRQVARAANSVPLSSSVERLVDALGKLEPSSMNSVLDKLGSWIRRFPDAVTPTKK